MFLLLHKLKKRKQALIHQVEKEAPEGVEEALEEEKVCRILKILKDRRLVMGKLFSF
jgi:hypothetical protein